MAWTIEFDNKATKEFKKLDRSSQLLIKNYLYDKISTAKDPKDLGKPLTNNMSGLWRYRVEKFRIICSIENNNLIILVLKVAKRDEVYKVK